MVRKIEDANIEDEFVESFRHINKEGNGLINAKELHEIMKTLVEADDIVTESECQAMIDLVDGDKDRSLNYEEYVKVML